MSEINKSDLSEVVALVVTEVMSRFDCNGGSKKKESILDKRVKELVEANDTIIEKHATMATVISIIESPLQTTLKAKYPGYIINSIGLSNYLTKGVDVSFWIGTEEKKYISSVSISLNEVHPDFDSLVEACCVAIDKFIEKQTPSETEAAPY